MWSNISSKYQQRISIPADTDIGPIISCILTWHLLFPLVEYRKCYIYTSIFSQPTSSLAFLFFFQQICHHLNTGLFFVFTVLSSFSFLTVTIDSFPFSLNSGHCTSVVNVKKCISRFLLTIVVFRLFSYCYQHLLCIKKN